MSKIYRNNQGNLFSQINQQWHKIVHPQSADCQDEVFEELVSPQCELIYPQLQNVSNCFENFQDFPEIANARVIGLEVIDHPWVDVESGFLLGIEKVYAQR
jgi:hypothetical protein